MSEPTPPAGGAADAPFGGPFEDADGQEYFVDAGGRRLTVTAGRGVVVLSLDGITPAVFRDDHASRLVAHLAAVTKQARDAARVPAEDFLAQRHDDTGSGYSSVR